MSIETQIASTFTPLPSDTDLMLWANTVLAHQHRIGSLTLRIVDEDEITTLNGTYRGKHKPTNVLSFPMEAPDEAELALLGDEENYLGDIVICAPIVQKEAQAQHKTFEAHFAHMVIHGTLHLMGYDHITDEEAAIMEPLEIEILQSLHFPNPYEVKHR